MPIRDLFCGVSRRGHQLFEGCGGYEISHWRGSRGPWNVGTIAERITHVVNNDQIRQTAASVQDKEQQAHAPEIVRPTAAEVVGRPSEPLPRYDPESVQPENT
jgi:hypothetical protein